MIAFPQLFMSPETVSGSTVVATTEETAGAGFQDILRDLFGGSESEAAESGGQDATDASGFVRDTSEPQTRNRPATAPAFDKAASVRLGDADAPVYASHPPGATTSGCRAETEAVSGKVAPELHTTPVQWTDQDVAGEEPGETVPSEPAVNDDVRRQDGREAVRRLGHPKAATGGGVERVARRLVAPDWRLSPEAKKSVGRSDGQDTEAPREEAAPDPAESARVEVSDAESPRRPVKKKATTAPRSVEGLDSRSDAPEPRSQPAGHRDAVIKMPVEAHPPDAPAQESATEWTPREQGWAIERGDADPAPEFPPVAGNRPRPERQPAEDEVRNNGFAPPAPEREPVSAAPAITAVQNPAAAGPAIPLPAHESQPPVPQTDKHEAGYRRPHPGRALPAWFLDRRETIVNAAAAPSGRTAVELKLRLPETAVEPAPTLQTPHPVPAAAEVKPARAAEPAPRSRSTSPAQAPPHIEKADLTKARGEPALAPVDAEPAAGQYANLFERSGLKISSGTDDGNFRSGSDALMATSGRAAAAPEPAVSDPHVLASDSFSERTVDAAEPVQQAEPVEIRTEYTQTKPISLVIGESESQDRVTLVLAERAGHVRVSVRTADQALGDDLQRDVGHLVERLEEIGYSPEAVGVSDEEASRKSFSDAQEQSERQRRFVQEEPAGRRRQQQRDKEKQS